MYNIATIVGTRPEIIKLSRVISVLDQHTNHTLIHTGQNYDYELNEIFFEDLEIRKPDHFLEAASGTPMETVASVLVKVEKLLAELKPDAILIYGDTNSCISTLAAKRLKIPIFHMEAGNRCYDQRVPEEVNRKLVDHLSDINMTLSEHGRRNLLAEGLSANMIFKVGSSMGEIFEFHKDKIENSNILKDLQLASGSYILVSAHREENVDSPEKLSSLLKNLKDLSSQFGKRIIFSTHPRTRKRIEALGGDIESMGVELMKPFSFSDYCHLQKHSFCVISDSGTLMEETSCLGLRSIHLRDSFERPEGMDAGIAPVIPITNESLAAVVKMVTETPPRRQKVEDYFSPDLSQKVLNIILSHIDLINREVWRR